MLNIFSVITIKHFLLSFGHRYIEIFIQAYVDTQHFVLVVYAGDDTKCRTKSSQMGKKIYKLLKER